MWRRTGRVWSGCRLTGYAGTVQELPKHSPSLDPGTKTTGRVDMASATDTSELTAPRPGESPGPFKGHVVVVATSLVMVVMLRKVARPWIAFSRRLLVNFESLCRLRHSQ